MSARKIPSAAACIVSTPGCNTTEIAGRLCSSFFTMSYIGKCPPVRIINLGGIIQRKIANDPTFKDLFGESFSKKDLLPNDVIGNIVTQATSTTNGKSVPVVFVNFPKTRAQFEFAEQLGLIDKKTRFIVLTSSSEHKLKRLQEEGIHDHTGIFERHFHPMFEMIQKVTETMCKTESISVDCPIGNVIPNLIRRIVEIST